MTVYFIDGWDWGTELNLTPSSTNNPQKYVDYSSGGGNSIQPGRQPSGQPGGGNSIEFGNAAFRQTCATRFVGATPATLVLGFAYRPGAVRPNSSVVRIESGHATLVNPGSFDDGTNEGTVIWLWQQTDGTMKVVAGDGTQCGTPNFPGTVLATLNTTFAPNVWRYIELVASASGWSVYVDDVLDTAQSVALPVGAGMDRYSFIHFTFESCRIDDHYAADTRLGPCRVTGSPPAVGSTHQWAPLAGTNLSQVHEFGNLGTPTPDGDTTYVASSNAGDLDLYQMTATACYGRVLAVALNASGRAAVSSPSVNLMFKALGNLFTIGSGASMGGVYRVSQAVAALNPSNSSTWTDSAITGSLFGYQMASGGTARVTQFFIEKLVSLRNMSFDCGQGSYGFSS